MATQSSLFGLSDSAIRSLDAMESMTKASVFDIFSRYESNVTSYGDLKLELARTVRSSFMASGAVAIAHMNSVLLDQGVELPDRSWSPSERSETLTNLLADVKRNSEAFRDSSRDDVSLRRLRFRSWLSVQTAIRRGFTEGQLEYAKSLAGEDLNIMKVWIANFTSGGVPCAHCRALHGTKVPFNEEFSHGAEGAPKVYGSLMGPNRHPNCRCYLLVYVETDDFSVTVAPAPPANVSGFMSARDVRRLPKAAFTAVVTTLRLIAGKLRGALRGKR